MRKWIIIFVLFGMFSAVGESGAQAQFFLIEEGDLAGEQAPEFTTECVRMEKKWLGTAKPTWTKRSLTKYRQGERAIIYFWAIWCVNCREHLTELQSRRATFAKEKIKVLAVNIGDPKKQVEKYLKKHKIDLDIFLDTKGEVESAYQIYVVPTFHFVNKDGKITAIRHHLPEDYHTLLDHNSTTQEESRAKGN